MYLLYHVLPQPGDLFIYFTMCNLNQENLVKINVYYDSLNEKSIKEKIDYSLEVVIISIYIIMSDYQTVQSKL